MDLQIGCCMLDFPFLSFAVPANAVRVHRHPVDVGVVQTVRRVVPGSIFIFA
jgi:hypothetical protein